MFQHDVSPLVNDLLDDIDDKQALALQLGVASPSFLVSACIAKCKSYCDKRKGYLNSKAKARTQNQKNNNGKTTAVKQEPGVDKEPYVHRRKRRKITRAKQQCDFDMT